MKMLNKNKNQGFTIVELLIVIVVIGILAALALSSFSGAQAKARNTSRVSDIASIQKALEMYRAQNGVYPVTTPPYTNVPAGFTSRYSTSGYAHSIATNDSWLRELRLSGFMNNPPKDPINDNTHYYMYLSYDANGVGACSGPLYVLVAYGWEGGASSMPKNSRTLNCSNGSITAGWIQDGTQAVFSNTTTP